METAQERPKFGILIVYEVHMMVGGEVRPTYEVAIFRMRRYIEHQTGQNMPSLACGFALANVEDFGK
jgi:hypothetical protein